MLFGREDMWQIHRKLECAVISYISDNPNIFTLCMFVIKYFPHVPLEKLQLAFVHMYTMEIKRLFYCFANPKYFTETLYNGKSYTASAIFIF